MISLVEACAEALYKYAVDSLAIPELDKCALGANLCSCFWPFRLVPRGGMNTSIRWYRAVPTDVLSMAVPGLKGDSGLCVGSLQNAPLICITLKVCISN